MPAGTAAAAAGMRGVDVSSFQGTPAQWRAKAGAFRWAGVKMTEHYPSGGTYVNPDAAADWAFLAADGDKVRVAYAFGHPASSAITSASAFLAELARVGVHDGDAVALDLETTDGHTPAHVATWAGQFAHVVGDALDRPVVLYTFLSFAGAGNCAGLGHLPLWIADPSSPAGHPWVPAPWTAWALHQYGITGGLDRDIASWPSPAAMRAALGREPSPPATQLVDAQGKSFAQLAHAHGLGPAHLVRMQGGPHHPFTAGVSAYINGLHLDVPVPDGVKVRVPHSA